MTNEPMKTIIFSGIKELGSFMYNTSKTNGDIVCSVLFHDDAADLMKVLLSDPDVKVGYIELTPDYYKEYYVTLDYNLTLGVEPAWDNEQYLITDADFIFFDGNASSQIAFCNGGSQYELTFEKDVCDYNRRENSTCSTCSKDCSDCDTNPLSEAFDALRRFLEDNWD